MSCKTLTEVITLYSYKGRGYPSGCFEESVPFVHNCALRTQGPGIWCSLGFHVCCFFLFEYTDLLTLLKRFTEQFVGSHWRTLLVCAIAMDVALLYSSISSGGSGCNLQFSCTCWQLQWTQELHSLLLLCDFTWKSGIYLGLPADPQLLLSQKSPSDHDLWVMKSFHHCLASLSCL